MQTAPAAVEIAGGHDPLRAVHRGGCGVGFPLRRRVWFGRDLLLLRGCGSGLVSLLRRSSFGFASATVVRSARGFGFGVAPVAAGSEPRSSVAELAAATCVFEPKKPPKILPASDWPLLSATATGGGCAGRPFAPGGGTRAGGMRPPTCARNTRFMPPSRPE